MQIAVIYSEQVVPEVKGREIVITVSQLSWATRNEYNRLLREGIEWYKKKYSLEYFAKAPEDIPEAEFDRTYVALRAEILSVIGYFSEGPTRKYYGKIRGGDTVDSDYLLPEEWTDIDSMQNMMPVELFDELSKATRTLNRSLFPTSRELEDDPFDRVSSRVLLT